MKVRISKQNGSIKTHACFPAANACLFVAGGSGDDARRVQCPPQLETAQPKEEQRPLLDL